MEKHPVQWNRESVLNAYKNVHMLGKVLVNTVVNLFHRFERWLNN